MMVTGYPNNCWFLCRCRNGPFWATGEASGTNKPLVTSPRHRLGCFLRLATVHGSLWSSQSWWFFLPKLSCQLFDWLVACLLLLQELEHLSQEVGCLTNVHLGGFLRGISGCQLRAVMQALLSKLCKRWTFNHLVVSGHPLVIQLVMIEWCL